MIITMESEFKNELISLGNKRKSLTFFSIHQTKITGNKCHGLNIIGIDNISLRYCRYHGHSKDDAARMKGQKSGAQYTLFLDIFNRFFGTIQYFR